MKNLKYIFILLAVSLTSVSCFVDDEDETLDIFADTPYVIGFINKEVNESYFEDLGAIRTDYKIDLIGGQDGNPSDTDLVVSYAVNPASSAVEGREFDFADNSGTITIPAGSDVANIPILINTGNFDLSNPTVLLLDLVSVQGDEGIISENNSQLKITFVGCQADYQDYTYSMTIVRADGVVRGENLIEGISLKGVNSFRTETVGDFGITRGTYGGEPGFTFNDVCGEITVPDQNLLSIFGNQVYGSGSFDSETGDITITYAVEFGGNPTFYTATYTRQ